MERGSKEDEVIKYNVHENNNQSKQLFEISASAVQFQIKNLYFQTCFCLAMSSLSPAPAGLNLVGTLVRVDGSCKHTVPSNAYLSSFSVSEFPIVFRFSPLLWHAVRPRHSAALGRWDSIRHSHIAWDNNMLSKTGCIGSTPFKTPITPSKTPINLKCTSHISTEQDFSAFQHCIHFLIAL